MRFFQAAAITVSIIFVGVYFLDQALAQQSLTVDQRVAQLEQFRAETTKKLAEQDGDLSRYSLTNPPIGTVLPYAGVWPPPGISPAGTPWSEENTGWFLCDGRPLNRPEDGTKYEALRRVLGRDTAPDCQGYFLRGFDNGTGRDPDHALGTFQDDAFEAHSHTADVNDPGHQHWFSENGEGGPNTFGADNDRGVQTMHRRQTESNTTGISVTTRNSGASETRPKNVAVNFIIKYANPPIGR